MGTQKSRLRIIPVLQLKAIRKLARRAGKIIAGQSGIARVHTNRRRRADRPGYRRCYQRQLQRAAERSGNPRTCTDGRTYGRRCRTRTYAPSTAGFYRQCQPSPQEAFASASKVAAEMGMSIEELMKKGNPRSRCDDPAGYGSAGTTGRKPSARDGYGHGWWYGGGCPNRCACCTCISTSSDGRTYCTCCTCPNGRTITARSTRRNFGKTFWGGHKNLAIWCQGCYLFAYQKPRNSRYAHDRTRVLGCLKTERLQKSVRCSLQCDTGQPTISQTYIFN